MGGMSKTMAARRARLLWMIEEYGSKYGYSPSAREMASVVLACKSTVGVDIEVLEALGYLETSWMGGRRLPRTYRVTKKGHEWYIPIVAEQVALQKLSLSDEDAPKDAPDWW